MNTLDFPQIATRFQRGLYKEELAPYTADGTAHANFEQRHYRRQPAQRGVFFYPARSVQSRRNFLRTSIIRLPSEEVGIFK